MAFVFIILADRRVEDAPHRRRTGRGFPVTSKPVTVEGSGSPSGSGRTRTTTT
jgi:hypothetical protein